MTTPTRRIKEHRPVKLRLSSLLLLLPLAACSRGGEIEDGGIYTYRSACPQVAIPAGTGDITLFAPAGSTDSSALDVTAAITNLRATCTETATDVISTATFSVVATRRDAASARQVVLPFFDVAVQAGNRIVAKQVGGVALNFPAGSLRAQTSARGTIRVSRSVATLPENVRQILNQKRKVGDQVAAIDPLSDPAVRDAVARATFQHLIGFQMTDAQLRYNATR
jgi:hypothetical protein